MEKIALLCLICLMSTQLGQAQEIKKLDVSPLDFAVFRPNGQESKPITRIIYSRPQKNGRVIFGELVPYGKIWRTGANQTTEINVYRDLVFMGKTLKAGNYSMYTIPGEKEWTIIFNSKLFTWGTYDYDATKDVLKFKVRSTTGALDREDFGIAFKDENGKGKILLAWEFTEVYIPFTY